MSERDKMMAGEWYDANYDEAIVAERLEAKSLCDLLNQTPHNQVEQRLMHIRKILKDNPEGLEIMSPFVVDYGVNIKFGRNVFVNHYCYFMDGAPITIGNHVFIGPSVGFYTANHPLAYPERNAGLEKAEPITVGDNCWFGANVTVLPGVNIGAGSVIAAGSVVSKDVPANSLVAGVPAKVIREIDQTQGLK